MKSLLKPLNTFGQQTLRDYALPGRASQQLAIQRLQLVLRRARACLFTETEVISQRTFERMPSFELVGGGHCSEGRRIDSQPCRSCHPHARRNTTSTAQRSDKRTCGGTST